MHNGQPQKHNLGSSSLDLKDYAPRLEWILQEYTLLVADVKNYSKKLIDILSAEYGVYTQNRLRLIKQDNNNKFKSQSQIDQEKKNQFYDRYRNPINPSTLKAVDLSRCQSEVFPSLKVLMIFPEMRELNLSYNRLKSLPSNFGMNVRQLQKLDLSYNLFDNFALFISKRETNISISDVYKIVRNTQERPKQEDTFLDQI